MSLVGQSSFTTQIDLLQSYPQSTRPPPHVQAWKADAMKLPAHSLYADEDVLELFVSRALAI